MATIDVPDTLVEPWPKFDEGLEMLKRTGKEDGLSTENISQFFTVLAGRAPWQNPSFALWAYIRHGAACYNDFKELLDGWRNDRHGMGTRRHLLRSQQDAGSEAEQIQDGQT